MNSLLLIPFLCGGYGMPDTESFTAVRTQMVANHEVVDLTDRETKDSLRRNIGGNLVVHADGDEIYFQNGDGAYVQIEMKNLTAEKLRKSLPDDVEQVTFSCSNYFSGDAAQFVHLVETLDTKIPVYVLMRSSTLGRHAYEITPNPVLVKNF